MIIRHDSDGSVLSAISAAPRAMVFLTVLWSSYERHARRAFTEAAEQLATAQAKLGIEFFSLGEDAEWCQVWLASLQVPQLGGGYPLGSGSMLWLENGRCVLVEVGGAALRRTDIVARSLRLWESAE